MKIRLKGFGREKEEDGISSKYRVNSESLNWNIKGFGSVSEGRDKNLLRSLWNLYQKDETTWAVIQAISTISLGEEFELEGVSKDSEEFKQYKRSFDRMWLNLYDVVRDTLIFGNSFSKIILNRAGEFYDIIPYYPLDVNKTQLEDGSYQYTVGKKVYTDSEIFECMFFNRPDSLYGFPLLGASKDAILRKRIIESNIATAVQRHMPRFHVKVSPDPYGRYPSEEERVEIGKKFKNLASDQEFVSSNLVNVEVLDTKSTIPQLEDYMMWSLNSILIGAGTPAEIVGAITKSGSFATSKARSNVWLSFTVRYYQKMLQRAINNQILKDNDLEIKILPPSELALPYSK